MTIKGILRYVIAVVILAVLLSIILPLIGIPRSIIVAPPIAYLQAAGTTTGYVYSKDTSPTANPFHVGDLDYFVRYQFRAPAMPAFGQHTVTPGTVVYKGHAQVEQSFYGSAQYGQQVPVKFDPGYPIINGVTIQGGGRNGDDGGGILSAWIAWDIGILIVAYPLAMLLERLFLRESY